LIDPYFWSLVASSVLPEKIDQVGALALHQQLDDLAENLQIVTDLLYTPRQIPRVEADREY
jgi:hypothetical protein